MGFVPQMKLGTSCMLALESSVGFAVFLDKTYCSSRLFFPSFTDSSSSSEALNPTGESSFRSRIKMGCGSSCCWEEEITRSLKLERRSGRRRKTRRLGSSGSGILISDIQPSYIGAAHARFHLKNELGFECVPNEEEEEKKKLLHGDENPLRNVEKEMMSQCSQLQFAGWDDGNGISVGGGGGGGGGGDGDGVDDGFSFSDGPGHSCAASLAGILIFSSRNRRRIRQGWATVVAIAGALLVFMEQDAAIALTGTSSTLETEKRANPETNTLTGIWEVKGGRWRHFKADSQRDTFVLDSIKNNEDEAMSYEKTLTDNHNRELKEGEEIEAHRHKGFEKGLKMVMVRFIELGKRVMLPEGYPGSVTSDYMEYTLWRMGQIIASQISGVLTTQALLYAVGLGKGAIPTAAAVNWVLRDGIGYLSKIVLSKYGRHFDVHPKGWRLISDVLEDMSYGLELLTPTFPHLFVYLAAAAGAGRSASGLIQAATRSCFNAGMAAQRNFAEVIAKGEAQGMVSKSVGIALGIALSGYVGSSGAPLVFAFGVVTAFHIFCNLKSYQAVQLRTLNPYRASLILTEYFKSGRVPSVREVNGEEPIFPKVAFCNFRLRGSQGQGTSLSEQTKEVATSIEHNLELGARFDHLVHTCDEADAVLDVYSKENYLLAKNGTIVDFPTVCSSSSTGTAYKWVWINPLCTRNEAAKIFDFGWQVVLRQGATPQDMLRAMVQALYLNHLESSEIAARSNIVGDCSEGGLLRVSHTYMVNQFEKIRQDLRATGWIMEGLIARPATNRLLDVSLPE